LTSYFICHCFARGLRRRCDFAFPFEGARLLSLRPRGINHSFWPVDSARRQLFQPHWRGTQYLGPPPELVNFVDSPHLTQACCRICFQLRSSRASRSLLMLKKNNPRFAEVSPARHRAVG
jgi:hypothetical protein